LLGGENRRLVVLVKKMEQEERGKLTDALRVVMGERLAVVDQPLAKKLLAKTVDHSKLFSLAGKRGRGDSPQPRYGDRGAGGGREGDGYRSIVSRYGGVEKTSCNYWTDPAVLLSTSHVQLQVSQGTVNLSRPTVPVCKYEDPLDLTCSTSNPLLSSHTSAPLPTITQCSCMQDSCYICRPSKAVSQPTGRGTWQGLDIVVIFAESKEEFFKVNLASVASKLPGEETLQAKYLEMKWYELMVAKKNEEEEGDKLGQVKRPRINVVKNLSNHPQGSANIQSPEVDVIHQFTQSYKPQPSFLPTATTRPHLPVIATVLSDQSSPPTGKCSCEDCMYVTKSHLERTRIAKTKCRCHPCVLRDKQLAGRGAKPWELVTMANYEGENYWLEPWIEDLFKNIEQKKVSVKQAAALTGTTYGQVYRHFKERQGR